MVYLAAFIPVQGGFDYLLFLQHCDQGTSSHAVHYLFSRAARATALPAGALQLIFLSCVIDFLIGHPSVSASQRALHGEISSIDTPGARSVLAAGRPSSVNWRSAKTDFDHLYSFTSFRKCYVQLPGQLTSVEIKSSLFEVTKI